MNVSVEYIFDIKPSNPAAAGFFVCGMMGRFNNGFVSNGKRNVKEYV